MGDKFVGWSTWYKRTISYITSHRFGLGGRGGQRYGFMIIQVRRNWGSLAKKIAMFQAKIQIGK